MFFMSRPNTLEEKSISIVNIKNQVHLHRQDHFVFFFHSVIFIVLFLFFYHTTCPNCSLPSFHSSLPLQTSRLQHPKMLLQQINKHFIKTLLIELLNCP